MPESKDLSSQKKDELKAKTPEVERESKRGGHVVEAHVGPIPAPWSFKQYEEILPGSADRILAMAEASQRTEHMAVNAAIKRDQYKYTTVRWTIWGALLMGFALHFIERSPGTFALFVGELATLAGVVTYQSVGKRK